MLEKTITHPGSHFWLFRETKSLERAAQILLRTAGYTFLVPDHPCQAVFEYVLGAGYSATCTNPAVDGEKYCARCLEVFGKD